MTLPLIRRQARRTGRVVLSVRDHWRVDATGVIRREVLVREPSGELRRGYLPDEHPALVSFLARAAA